MKSSPSPTKGRLSLTEPTEDAEKQSSFPDFLRGEIWETCCPALREINLELQGMIGNVIVTTRRWKFCKWQDEKLRRPRPARFV
jgi:hypothetical protein